MEEDQQGRGNWKLRKVGSIAKKKKKTFALKKIHGVSEFQNSGSNRLVKYNPHLKCCELDPTYSLLIPGASKLSPIVRVDKMSAKLRSFFYWSVGG